VPMLLEVDQDSQLILGKLKSPTKINLSLLSRQVI